MYLELGDERVNYRTGVITTSNQFVFYESIVSFPDYFLLSGLVQITVTSCQLGWEFKNAPVLKQQTPRQPTCALFER